MLIDPHTYTPTYEHTCTYIGQHTYINTYTHWFEIWRGRGLMSTGLKTGGSWIPKVQQTVACSTWLRVSSTAFLF